MKLYGINPVIERLKSNPRSIRRIYIEEGHRELTYIGKKVHKWGIPLLVVPATKLLKMARSLNTQGVLAEVEGFGYVPYDELLELSVKKRLTILFLDGMTDPQNFGSLLRSAACLGGFAVVLPTHDSVEITDSVLRVACGAENHIPVAKVANLGLAVDNAKKSGFWVAASVVEGGDPLPSVDLPFPLALLIGSEQKGVRAILLQKADSKISIPMGGPKLSLNVAQAASILCYEVLRQRAQKGSRS